MADTQRPQPAPSIARGITRQFRIPSCFLTADDLRRLYQVLEKKAHEAAERQAGLLQKQAGQTDQEFAQLKEHTKSFLKLVVRVQGSNGEWIASTGMEALTDDALPDRIISVAYDSAFLFRGAFNLQPQNGFSLALDFSRTSILDLTNLALQPDLNQSVADIAGADDGWAKSTFEEIQTFFTDRRRSLRGWLHSRYCYDVLVVLLGFPSSFAFVYRIDRAVSSMVQLPNALSVALYVYLVLVALFGFRVLFNYGKWVFAKVEGPTRLHGGPIFHKAVLGVVGATLLTLVVQTLLRIVGVPLF